MSLRIRGRQPKLVTMGEEGAVDETAGLAEAAQRVHALAKQPPVDPKFRHQLWEDLMSNAAISGATTLPGSAVFVPNGRADRRRPVIQTPKYARYPRPTVRAICFLATALLVATVIGMIFLVQRLDHRTAAPTLQIAGSPTPGQSSEWPMYRADSGRSGAVSGTGPLTNPSVLWSFHAGGKITGVPAISGGVVFIPSSDGNMYALDANTGAVVWKTAMGTGSGSSPIVTDGVVLIDDGLQGLQGFDIKTGESLFRHSEGIAVTAPGPMVDQVLITLGRDQTIHAVSPKTAQGQVGAIMGGGASHAASTDGALVLAGTGDGHIGAFEVGKTEPTWLVDMGGGIVDVAVVKNGVVYATSYSGANNELLALDAKTGAKLWSFQTADKTGFHAPAVGDATLYLPAVDGNLYALDTKTGKQVFSFNAGAALTTSPALAGSLVYLTGSDANLHAIDAGSGNDVWRMARDARSQGGPAVANGKIYLATDSGAVMAIAGNAPGAAAAAPIVSSPVGASAPAAAGPTFAWASSPGANTTPFQPLGVAVAPDGKIWQASAPGQFAIFDASGKYLESWGTAGTEPGQSNFHSPSDTSAFIAFAPDGSFYVSDLANARVEHFDKDRKFLGEWGMQGTGDGKFRAPYGIAIAVDGTVWVADPFQGVIQQFDASGKFLSHFDGAGSTDGKFTPLAGIAFDHHGRLIVVEGMTGRVRVFDKALKQVGVLDLSGAIEPTWNNPNDVGVDANDNIYVADANSALVRVFGPGLKFKYQWGRRGSG